MKKVFVLSLLLIGGCSSMIGYNFTAGSKESVAKKIVYNYDEFEREGWLETEMYRGSSAQPGTNYKYRAYYTKNSELSFIQIYAKTFNSDWCFINRISEFNGNVYNFHEISRDVSSSGSVSVVESFALDVTKSQLEQLAQNNTKFKAIGQKCDSTFEIDKNVSSAFLDAVNADNKNRR
ncbi:hypothetical protein [Shewanella aestuarii]|uniref:Lipoprotein n=1 Tax=Shewanella aestuarii TaxID=1028752 RepID=A0A6G9QQ89_9GAMM|nr:hypothetical protein [Shewanella aestuarii]QIR16632.1 hypothetical protein HBH39_19340 [Shewanella aestuarii]